MGNFTDYFSVIDGTANDEISARVQLEIDEAGSPLGEFRTWILERHTQVFNHPKLLIQDYLYCLSLHAMHWTLSWLMLWSSFGVVVATVCVAIILTLDCQSLFKKRRHVRGTFWEAVIGLLCILMIVPILHASILAYAQHLIRPVAVLTMWAGVRQGFGLRSKIEQCRLTYSELITNFMLSFVMAQLVMLFWVALLVIPLTFFVTKEVALNLLFGTSIYFSTVGAASMAAEGDNFHCRVWHVLIAAIIGVAEGIVAGPVAAIAFTALGLPASNEASIVIFLAVLALNAYVITANGIRSWGNMQKNVLGYELWKPALSVPAMARLKIRWQHYVAAQELIYPPPEKQRTGRQLAVYPLQSIFHQYAQMLHGARLGLLGLSVGN